MSRSEPFRRVPLEEVVHPSVGARRIEPNLPIELSSYEFRAYHNGGGTIVMHLRAVLLVTTNTSFNITGHLYDVFGTLTLPNQVPLSVEEFWFTEAPAFPYDGRVMGVDFGATVRTELSSVRASAAEFFLQIDFNIHGAPFRGVINRDAVIVPRRRPRNANQRRR